MNKPENAAFLSLIVSILFLTDFTRPFWMILLISFSVALFLNLISSANQSNEVTHHED
ncbi:MAG: hypothetical protein AAF902_24300 [Chloroflexota bacterium]